jgi:hypothetical protein
MGVIQLKHWEKNLLLSNFPCFICEYKRKKREVSQDICRINFFRPRKKETFWKRARLDWEEIYCVGGLFKHAVHNFWLPVGFSKSKPAGPYGGKVTGMTLQNLQSFLIFERSPITQWFNDTRNSKQTNHAT